MTRHHRNSRTAIGQGGPARALLLAARCSLLALPCIASATDIEVWHDAVDAVIRRTDPGMAGPLNPASVLPDVVMVTLSGWASATAASNPYAGFVQEENPDLFRLEVTFHGLVNPPGTITPSHDPFVFGPSPVYGFLEFDADREENTGGDLGAAALHRYLSNVGRFGTLPDDSHLGPRAAYWGDQVDGSYVTLPQYERSGTEFTLTFCGCFTPQIESGDANSNGVFDAGETWIVRGNFWQRAEGYRLASFMQGGPLPGLWQPEVRLRWSHSAATGRTSVTLVQAMTQAGAAQLAGAPAQPINHSYSPTLANLTDHTSIREALSDLIDAASVLPLSGPTADLALAWASQGFGDSMDPTRWEAKGIFGTAYAAPMPTAQFVWTDVGFDEYAGDFNYDGFATAPDRQIVRDEIALLDGSARDGDGAVNGSVEIIDFGPNFCAYDLNNSGRVDLGDRIWYCPADQNDDGLLNVADFTAFLQAFSASAPWADIDGSGSLNVADFSAFLQRFALGCPPP